MGKKRHRTLRTWKTPNDIFKNLCPTLCSYREHLDFDYLVVLMLFALPWHPWYNGKCVDLRQVTRKLPWGALVIYSGSHLLGFVVKVQQRFSLPTYSQLCSSRF